MLDPYKLLAEDLKDEEKFVPLAYKCPADKLTIGYGRNIDVGGKGLSEPEASFLLSNDVRDSMREAATLFPSWVTLDPVRQATLANLCFNMGLYRLSGFVKMIEAVERKDWNDAADELQSSRWFRQVGRRGPKHVARLRAGVA